MVRERKYIKSDVSRRVVGLIPAFALAFAVTVALPVSTDTGFAVHGALAAGNGNAGGNGKGKALGKAGAPGQQQEQAADADEQAADPMEQTATLNGGAITETGAGGGEIAEATPEDAGNQVVQELAGLPENSALTEEEEQEAIRSGWGTWKTADGPETITAQ